MKPGDIIYYYEHWSDNIIKAEIEKTGLYARDFSDDAQLNVVAVKMLCAVDYTGEELCKVPGSCCKKVSDLYESPQSAYDAYQIEQHTIIKEYCNEINSLEELLRFPLEHCLYGEEYTDNAACRAYKIKAKELAGIDLDC